MSKNIIKINRGDSCEFEVRVPDKSNANKSYILNSDTENSIDVLYFAILHPRQQFEDAFFIEGYDHNDYIYDYEKDTLTDRILIKISPKDTLMLSPGIYYYTVKLFRLDPKKALNLDVFANYNNLLEARTIIERTKFIVNE